MRGREACWKLTDPVVGVSLWWRWRDAERVARARGRVCRIERHAVEAGDVVSELGAPDERIGRARQ